MKKGDEDESRKVESRRRAAGFSPPRVKKAGRTSAKAGLGNQRETSLA